MKETIFDKIKLWADERKIYDQKFSPETHATFFIEETLEALGYNHGREFSIWLMTNMDYHYKEFCQENNLSSEKNEITDDLFVDSCCDLVTFSTNAVYHKGYDMNKSMDQVYREISSRSGSIVNGKFKKDTSPEAVARHYKADFSGCKYIEPEESDTITHVNGLKENDSCFYFETTDARKFMKKYKEFDPDQYAQLQDVQMVTVGNEKYCGLYK